MNNVVGIIVDTNETKVILTNVILNKDEIITKFYASSSLVAFHTSGKKLYVSRNYNSKLSVNQISNHVAVEFDIDVIPESENIINSNGDAEDNISNPSKVCGIDILDAVKIYSDNYPDSSNYGFDLLETDVDDVIMGAIILFIKNKQTNIFAIKNTKYFNKSSIMTKIIGKPFGYYFQLLLPLIDIDQYMCGPNFIYMQNGLRQYILWTRISNSRAMVKLIQLDANPKIDVNDIMFCQYTKQLMINLENNFCEYSFIKHTFTPIRTNVKKISMDSNYNVYFNTITNNVQKIRVYNNNTIIKSKTIPVRYNIINFFMLNNHLGIITNIGNASSPIGEIDGMIKFNISNVRYYAIASEYMLYCDTKDTLHLVTSKTIKLPFSNKTRISNWNSKLTSIEYTMYIVYPLSNFPEDTKNIVSIQTTKFQTTIQTTTKLYCYNYNKNTFEAIIFGEEFISINKSLISYNSNNNNSTTSLDIDATFGSTKNTNLFDKLLIMSSTLILTQKKISVNLIDRMNHKTIASGKGPTKEFINEALVDFSDKYLVVNPNKTVEYNTTAMSSFTDLDLVSVGNMLSYIIFNHGMLPIRLPLTLLSTILKKVPTNKELEYFLKIYDQDVLTNVLMYKYDHENMLTFGFGNYHTTLRAMCKFHSDDSIKRLDRLISLGFNNYHKISNIDKMDLPTLEYMMSGDFIINKKKFAEDIKIDDDNCKFDKVAFRSKIEKLTDDQFRTMLKNWSASYVIDPKSGYSIGIDNSMNTALLTIQTCTNSIYINPKANCNLDNLIAQLIEPINSMRG